MWTYSQKTGELRLNGALVGIGYSGHEAGKNNPAMQDVKFVGPIPQGKWRFIGPPFDSLKHGPFILRIIPEAGTQTFGRTGLLLHGDGIHDPGDASEGCMVQIHPVRKRVWDFIANAINGPDRNLLEVTE